MALLQTFVGPGWMPGSAGLLSEQTGRRLGWSGSGAIKGSELIFSTSHRRWHWGQWEDGIITKAAILCPVFFFSPLKKVASLHVPS